MHIYRVCINKFFQQFKTLTLDVSILQTKIGGAGWGGGGGQIEMLKEENKKYKALENVC